MSATLPDRFVDMLSNSINIKDLKILEGTQIEESKRLKVDIKRITKKFNYKKIKNKKTCIIYCNTIKRAIDAYHNLIKLGVDEKRLVLYHSSFKEEDKINIEKNIIEKLGEDAWKNGVADGIVIMTQIGELSINISSDYIITDICPIDRLVQRFGRGSRFDTNLCVVDVIIPTKNNLLYPAPYGNYNRKDGWNENIYLKRTRKHLKKGLYSYDDFITIINKVYDDMILEEKSIENALLLRKMNKTNIFFNKGVKLDDEFNDVDWVARDINNQAKVYVGIPNNYYESYDKYNLDFKNKSVSVPLYKYQNLLKNNIIEYFEILIKNKKENIYVLNETYYSDVFGFIG
jgi:CRISPR-associated endonuclease/helicase Cas3